MLLLTPPGVYRAEGDTELLVDVMNTGGYATGRRVLDIGTGSGALAVAAARAGAGSVTAVDLSLRSVCTAWLNGLVNGAPIRVRRGDLVAPVRGRRFDLILSNPPYVPAAAGVLPRHRIARCWDAGVDGRALLDRICTEAPAVLAPGGVVLIVQSAVSGTDETVERMAASGLEPRVVTTATVPFGPVMHSRAALLEARGLIRPGDREEQLVVVEGRLPG